MWHGGGLGGTERQLGVSSRRLQVDDAALAVLLPAVAAKRGASAQSLPTQSQKREKPVGRTPAGRVRLLTRMGVTRPGDDLPEDWVQHPQVRRNNLLSAAPGISPELPGYPRL